MLKIHQWCLLDTNICLILYNWCQTTSVLEPHRVYSLMCVCSRVCVLALFHYCSCNNMYFANILFSSNLSISTFLNWNNIVLISSDVILPRMAIFSKFNMWFVSILSMIWKYYLKFYVRVMVTEKNHGKISGKLCIFPEIFPWFFPV